MIRKIIAMPSILKKTILVLLIVGTLMATPVFTKDAYAQCCGCCECWEATVWTDLWGWVQNWIEINLHIFLMLYFHRLTWFDLEFWQMLLLPAMAMMGEQLAAVGMQEMQIIGSFLDAKEQLEAQRDLQRMQARAHKDYHPSIEMCEFGSRVKTLITSERRGEITALAMSQRSLDRMLGNKSSLAPFGRKDDVKNRLAQFREKYCDRSDNNGALKTLCTGPANPSSAEIGRYNKDIDYTRTLSKPWSLEVDLTNAAVSKDEEDLMALGANMYGFFTTQGVDPLKLANNPKKTVNLAQQAYLDLRSYVAKQSVAENSFNEMIAMKSQGTGASKLFLDTYMKELGVPGGDVNTMIGLNPSYFTQMEVLTKLAYQHPLFYTNLYDKPANVARKGAAIQAISLMQKFDLFKSYLRTEASLSVLLELEVENLQREVEDSIRIIDASSDMR